MAGKKTEIFFGKKINIKCEFFFCSTAKEEFIRHKHEDLAYILRGEQEADGPEGLGAQLHAAARTGDLLTSLRLFSQGADPNFYHEEKGSCPLHVAAKTNQMLQAELLLIYGADLNRRDSAGRTPEDVAKDSGHLPLAERLRTAKFHVFDRLVQYLCLRKTGQANGLEELCLEFGELSPARTKLESVIFYFHVDPFVRRSYSQLKKKKIFLEDT